MDYSEIDYSGIDYSGIDYSGIDYSGIGCSGIGYSGMAILELAIPELTIRNGLFWNWLVDDQGIEANLFYLLDFQLRFFSSSQQNARGFLTSSNEDGSYLGSIERSEGQAVVV
jgi:hypothetical protein